MSAITLKAARVNAGFTQAEVAEKIGVAPSTLRNWENGITFPKQPAIEKMCELYNVSYDNLKFEV